MDYIYNPNTNELYHYGVKGMKWGVRRYQNKNGSLTPAGKKRRKSDDYHSDYKRAHDKTSVKNMSDKELRERINRLQMEQQYKNLNKRQKSAGEKWATGILVGAAGSIASSYANKYMKKGAAWAGEKLLDGAANVVGDIIIKQMKR